METMERKNKVATVKMERMKGPGGRLCPGRARQGGRAEAAQRSRQQSAGSTKALARAPGALGPRGRGKSACPGVLQDQRQRKARGEEWCGGSR